MKKALVLVLAVLLVGCKYTPPTEPKYTFFEHVRVYNDYSREGPRSTVAVVPKPFMLDMRPVEEEYKYMVSYELD